MISGTVEVVKGNAELERLLDNVQQHMRFGDYGAAEKTSEEIVAEYPSDYSAWWALLKAMLERHLNSDSQYMQLRIETIKKTIELYRRALSLADDKKRETIITEWNSIWERLLIPVHSGSCSLSFGNAPLDELREELQTLCSLCSPVRKIIETGFANAASLSEAGIGIHRYIGSGYDGDNDKPCKYWEKLSVDQKRTAYRLIYVYGKTLYIKAKGWTEYAQMVEELPDFTFTVLDQTSLSTVMREVRN